VITFAGRNFGYVEEEVWIEENGLVRGKGINERGGFEYERKLCRHVRRERVESTYTFL
jgi:hypothetical protein